MGRDYCQQKLPHHGRLLHCRHQNQKFEKYGRLDSGHQRGWVHRHICPPDLELYIISQARHGTFEFQDAFPLHRTYCERRRNGPDRCGRNQAINFYRRIARKGDLVRSGAEGNIAISMILIRMRSGLAGYGVVFSSQLAMLQEEYWQVIFRYVVHGH